MKRVLYSSWHDWSNLDWSNFVTRLMRIYGTTFLTH